MTADLYRAALATHKPVMMAWVSLGVPYVVEQMGHVGYHAVLIDQQHGPGGQAEMVDCLTAARAAGLPALVRPLSADAGLIGQALDAGAQGVLCPLVRTVEDVEQIVQATCYPPRGIRSWGPYRGKFFIDGDYFEQANEWTLACVQIETRSALDVLDEILEIDDLDMVMVGPNDLAAALTGTRDINAQEVVDALDLVLRKCREHNIISAVYANNIAYARPLVAAGWDVVSVSTDIGLLTGAAARVLRELRP